METLRFGIAGRMRVGKTTVAQYLRDKWGFETRAFADPIKDFARLVGWDGAKDERGRRLLQEIGTVVRNYDEHFWIQRLLDELPGDKKIVVDDMRMFLEHQALCRVGFRTLLVVKDPSLIPDAPSARTSHVTEQEVDKITPWRILQNNGSFDDLYRQIDQVVYDIQEGKDESLQKAV